MLAVITGSYDPIRSKFCMSRHTNCPGIRNIGIDWVITLRYSKITLTSGTAREIPVQIKLSAFMLSQVPDSIGLADVF